jgi:hypothetical protein
MVARRARRRVIEIYHGCAGAGAGGRDSDTTVVGTQTEAASESSREHGSILIGVVLCHVMEPSAWR